jgi:hypothetical protein
MFIRMVCLLLLVFLFIPEVCFGERKTLVKGELAVVFDESGRGVAEDVAGAYPGLKAELEETLGWEADFRSGVTLVLLREEEFKEFAGAAPIVAFAASRKNTIVVGLLRAVNDPSHFSAILKHELAHLYLVGHIEEENLPKWINEGVSEWASGGISELLSVGRSTELEKATLLGNLIPLENLDKSFPRDDKRLRLAYEESLSVVEFIVDEYGRDGLRAVLGRLSAGEGVNDAFRNGLGVELEELERQWHDRLTIRHTLLAYLSNNIYTVLFVLAALITLYGFVRLIIRMKTYRDEDEEEPGPF